MRRQIYIVQAEEGASAARYKGHLLSSVLPDVRQEMEAQRPLTVSLQGLSQHETEILQVLVKAAAGYLYPALLTSPALSQQTDSGSCKHGRMLVTASSAGFNHLVEKLAEPQVGCMQLAEKLHEVLNAENHFRKAPVRKLDCRGKSLQIGTRTLIMGILNVTPDSFSDGGRYLNADEAIARARQMIEEGADLLDIGGESTRPGANPVTLEEELRRILPVVQALAGTVDVPLSVDTYKSEVARQALDAGAHIINDVWGLKKDPDMARTVARYGCPVIVMHNRLDRLYDDFLGDVVTDLRESIQWGLEQGISPNQIMIDPGIGFAKDHKQNLFLLNHLRTLVNMDYPLLLATSRKSTIQTVLGLPAEDVIEGTAATVALGIQHGCAMVRVHDVRAIKRTAIMADAIVRGNVWA